MGKYVWKKMRKKKERRGGGGGGKPRESVSLKLYDGGGLTFI